MKIQVAYKTIEKKYELSKAQYIKEKAKVKEQELTINKIGI